MGSASKICQGSLILIALVAGIAAAYKTVAPLPTDNFRQYVTAVGSNNVMTEMSVNGTNQPVLVLVNEYPRQTNLLGMLFHTNYRTKSTQTIVVPAQVMVNPYWPHYSNKEVWVDYQINITPVK